MAIVALAIQVYSYIVLAAVIVSWLRLDRSNPIQQVLNAATEPVLAPIRKVLPPMGGLDLSAMLLLVVLQVLKRLF